LQDEIEPVITGWMGHADRAKFEGQYRPAPGIARHLVGAPVVLGLLALETALDIWQDVDKGAFHKKRRTAGNLLIELVEQECGETGIELVSPRNADQRGAHVAFRHKSAGAIVEALTKRGVIGGFRVPDIIRFGIAPLALRYVDIWDAVQHLSQVLKNGGYEHVRS
jgi:kynureninase